MSIKFQLILLCLIFFSLNACKSPDQEKIQTDKIVISLENTPKGLNPLIYLSGPDMLVESLLFFPLADYNPVTLKYEPILIEKLPTSQIETSGDYKGKIRYDMDIIQEAKWDDGSPITASDFLFTIKAIFHPKTNAVKLRAYHSHLTDVIIYEESPKKITVYLDTKSIADMELLTSIPVLNKSFYDPNSTLEKVAISTLKEEANYASYASQNPDIEKFAEVFNSTKYSQDSVNGSGRYKLKEWLADQFLTLKKKENHFFAESTSPLKIAEANEIVLLFTPDQATALAQLKSGNLDIYDNISAAQLEDLRNDETYKDMFHFESVKTPKLYYLALNKRNAVLKEKSVRKALAYLCDVDTIISSYEKGYGERINSPFLSVDSKSELEDIKFNRKKAEEILAFDGWKDTNGNDILDKNIDGKLMELELEIMGTGSPLGELIGGVFNQLAAPSGIKIIPIIIDQTEYKKRLKNFDFAITTAAVGQSLSPYDPYPSLHTDNADPGEGNITNFGDDASNRLIEIIRTTEDEKTRDSAYLDLENMIAEDQPYIYLYAPTVHIVYKKNIEGIVSIKRPGFAINTFKRIIQ